MAHSVSVSCWFAIWSHVVSSFFVLFPTDSNRWPQIAGLWIVLDLWISPLTIFSHISNSVISSSCFNTPFPPQMRQLALWSWPTWPVTSRGSMCAMPPTLQALRAATSTWRSSLVCRSGSASSSISTCPVFSRCFSLKRHTERGLTFKLQHS